MKADIVDISSKVPGVIYSVSIEQGPDGVRNVRIHDVADDERSRKSVAFALREAADIIAPLDAASEPTKEMLDAARDWSAKKYGQPIGNDAAIGCWNAMRNAAPCAASGQKLTSDEADMVWPKHDSEQFSSSIDEAVDTAFHQDGLVAGQILTFDVAKRMTDVKVRILSVSVDEDRESIEWEIVAASEPKKD